MKAWNLPATQFLWTMIQRKVKAVVMSILNSVGRSSSGKVRINTLSEKDNDLPYQYRHKK